MASRLSWVARTLQQEHLGICGGGPPGPSRCEQVRENLKATVSPYACPPESVGQMASQDVKYHAQRRGIAIGTTGRPVHQYGPRPAARAFGVRRPAGQRTLSLKDGNPSPAGSRAWPASVDEFGAEGGWMMLFTRVAARGQAGRGRSLERLPMHPMALVHACGWRRVRTWPRQLIESRGGPARGSQGHLPPLGHGTSKFASDESVRHCWLRGGRAWIRG